uniref:Uncharacterized protein n=1 Tax=Oryza sativa subsp. japonica TaxID=39947 RepID=Q5Z9D8_ORYSJ|nr:hypothetical protein [Oryza sativa Japonica Group]
MAADTLPSPPLACVVDVPVLKPTPLRELKGVACWVPIVKSGTQVGLAIKPKG